MKKIFSIFIVLFAISSSIFAYDYYNFSERVEISAWLGGDVCMDRQLQNGFVGAELGASLRFGVYKIIHAGFAGGFIVGGESQEDDEVDSGIILGSDDSDKADTYEEVEAKAMGFFTAQVGPRFEIADLFVIYPFVEAGYFNGFMGAGGGITFQYGTSFGYFGTYAVDWCPKNRKFVDRYSIGISMHF